MSTTNICPCCSTSLLHHFGNHREYFFCRHCWAEMPGINSVEELKRKHSLGIINLSTNLAKLNQLAVTI